MYSLIGISMVLTGALLTSFAVSVVLSCTWRMLEAIARRLAPKFEARFWMFVGLAPAVAGVFAGLLVVAPAFLVHEPRHSEEEIGVWLAVLTAIAVLMVTVGTIRAGLVLLRATKASRLLRGCSHRLNNLSGAPDAYEIADGSSTSTVVGIFHPTMFFSRAVVTTLSGEEFASVLRHEQAHVTAYDNALKLLLDFAGILSANPLFSRAVKARWMESIELAADAAAVRDSGEALELLSALVKVAQLRRSETPIAQLGCGFVRFNRKSSLKRRVEQLERMADGIASEAIEVPRSMSLAWRCGLLALAVVAVYATPALMLFVHSGFERLMR